ncbi:CaiB/BaiF CoA transferase family protein [Streptomyces albipurpureus]|uniref:CoA transferase n=1 Tax=Streptomyces albipurpureus TaxID=2897419 RepID=A0ABT0UY90_9ACTN|nr:CaiB/BaiF CoA-transferase family protein [Streptomyces sp. CWNU-1]MCM2393392.1 CoA transferase [Streptomyces sp. CWNU-1]
MTAPEGPLTGLTVLDLSRMLAGPYCTMVLADLGATVLKVEPPFGDMIRDQGPYADGDELRAYGGYFQSVNRNKQGLVVDITRPEGPEVIRRLATTADILVENFRPGVMERKGIGYERLAEANPRLIYTAIRGFGDPRTGASPVQDWPSFDIVAQAMGGLLGITGPAGGPAVKTGPGFGDILPALFAATGTLAAVHERERTGRGRFVDVGMYDAVVAACERIVYQYSYNGVVAGPEGNAHPLLCPFGVFPARDGHIALAAAPADHHWVLLCEAMGLPELGRDPRYAGNLDRVARQAEVQGIVGEWTSRHTRAELTEALGGKVPFGPVNTADTLFDDPHLKARAMLQQVQHPGLERPVTIAATPIRYANGAEPAVHRAPLLGEHTDAVLRGAGYNDQEIEALRAAGVVAGPA